MSYHRGFILQPTYRIASGRPVVHIYGKLEDGRTFVVRDGRRMPHFYVCEADAAAAARHGASPLAPCGKRTFAAEPVVRVDLAAPADAPVLRDRLLGAGIACFEADVRFAIRYLIDHRIRGTIGIRGEPLAGGRDAAVAFDDPETGPEDWAPDPALFSVLSIDIETDPAARRLLSVALHGCGASEVLLLTPPGASCPGGALPLPTETALIEAFCRRVRQLDPDILTGWNVIDFDLAVLSRIAGGHGLKLEIGRPPGAVRIDSARAQWGSSYASVPGRVVLDGIQLLRSSFVRMDEYSLDAVAREILGEGKLLSGHDRAGAIERAFLEDRETFVAYNLSDARFVVEILRRLELIDLAVERSLLTGMPLDRVHASIAAFDLLYMSELGPRGVVAPTVGGGSDPAEPTTGGHVLEPLPGLYRNVVVFDFKSLYPSIIRTFQIDPLGHCPPPAPGEDPIVAPNGAAFRREPGILPRILDGLFPIREQAKATGKKARSQAVKILMNSFYGVLGTPACRFYNPEIANAITGFGRELLLWTKDRIEAEGFRVLYGDTDSLFVLSGEEDAAGARRAGETLVARLNRDLSAHVRTTWEVESRLELEFETLYVRLLLPAMRHGSGGARKRYAGLAEDKGKSTVVFTGMEVVRRDWTDLAKEVQREIYARLFSDRPVDAYLRRVVDDLRSGRLDAMLVYRKALRKDLGEYTATTPPHVAAARKMSDGPGRLVSYIVTTMGPEPASERRSPIHHEHYVQKQVRPVAEPVLSLLGLDFDGVVGDDTQLALF